MSDNVNVINTDEILKIIGDQLQGLIENDPEYDGYKFVITSELQWANNQYNSKQAKYDPKEIFIVVKLLPATLNYGQTLLPISMNVLGEQNKIDLILKLLILYTEKYNLEFYGENNYIRQYYQSPTVLSNFNIMGNGFRSLMIVNGTFQIAKDQNRLSIYYNSNVIQDGNTVVESVLLETITSGYSYQGQLDTQAFWEVSDLTKSRGQVGTLIVTFTMYLLSSPKYKILNDCIDVITGTASNGSDTSFSLTLKWSNGKTITENFKLAGFEGQDNLGEIPVVSVTMTL